MPEFVMLICDDEKERETLTEAESAANYAKIGAWWAEHEAAGRIKALSGRRLQRSRTARTVRVANAKAAVTDGPFIESKEVIGDFALLDAPDIEAAVALVKTWPGLPITIEVRPVIDG